MGDDKTTRSLVQAVEMSFLRSVVGVSHRDRVRSSAIREELRSEPLPLYLQRRQLEVRAFAKDAHWTPPLGGVPGTSSGEETSGKTQDEANDDEVEDRRNESE